jgi:archaellum biogenesis ATPase FlaH
MLNQNIHIDIDELIDAADFSDKPPTPKFSLNQFSVNGKSEVMRKKMHDDVFVLDGIAILGQLTVIYAKPNTGKTLITLAMLKDSIKAGRIKGENVYYINADDAYKGSIQKLELAEKYGFQMILPNSKESAVEFKVTEFNGYLQQLINDEAAHGVIIVLDTLKKFTDLMDKKKGSEFMKLAREFSLAGGTMIMLAHTNKNRSADGKVVAGGTSDIGDDACCAYTLDEVQGNSKTHKDVLFENFKSRGNVEKELLVSYSVIPTDSYFDKLDSVQVANDADIEQAKKERNAATKATEDELAINAIIDAIEQGNCKRLEIVAYVNKAWGVPRRKVNDALDGYAGTKLSNSCFWRVDKDSTAKIYHLLKPENVSPDDYEMAKNG